MVGILIRYLLVAEKCCKFLGNKNLESSIMVVILSRVSKKWGGDFHEAEKDHTMIPSSIKYAINPIQTQNRISIKIMDIPILYPNGEWCRVSQEVQKGST